MPRLTDLIHFHQGEAATINGSGGKTSLMWLLAGSHRESKVLVTTTTKIYEPSPGLYNDYRDSRTLLQLPVKTGITLAGERLPGESGKLGAIDPETLKKGRLLFDLALIEGDGSRRMPIKGWAENEPVTPDYTGCTIGVITLWPVGRQVNESIVFRLPEFCAVSGAREGDILTAGHVASAVAHPRGLFKGGRGRKVLLFNQAEDQQGERQAVEVLGALGVGFLGGLALVVAGSALYNTGKILWRNENE